MFGARAVAVFATNRGKALGRNVFRIDQSSQTSTVTDWIVAGQAFFT
jgi:hypothetical protein